MAATNPSVTRNCLYCSLPANQQCSRCTRVGFCSIEHQNLMWPSHKYRCSRIPTEFIQPVLKRWETDAFAKYTTVRRLIGALKVAPKGSGVTGPNVLMDFIPTGARDFWTLNSSGTPEVFPQDFWERLLNTPGISTLLLIDALPKICSADILPLDYFWNLCYAHIEENVTAQKADTLRGQFRSIIRLVTSNKAATDKIYSLNGYYGFYRASLTMCEFRATDNVHPLLFRTQLADAFYVYWTVQNLLENGSKSETAEEREEIDRISEGAFDHLDEVFRRIFDHEWKLDGDGLVTAYLSAQMADLHVPFDLIEYSKDVTKSG